MKVKDKPEQPKPLKKILEIENETLKTQKPKTASGLMQLFFVTATMHQVHRYHLEIRFLTLCVLSVYYHDFQWKIPLNRFLRNTKKKKIYDKEHWIITDTAGNHQLNTPRPSRLQICQNEN